MVRILTMLEMRKIFVLSKIASSHGTHNAKCLKARPLGNLTFSGDPTISSLTAIKDVYFI